MTTTFVEGYSTGTVGAQNYNGTSQTVVPTPPTGTRRVVSSMSFCNTGSTAKTLSLSKFWGYSPQSEAKLLVRSLAAGETYVFNHQVVLKNLSDNNGSLQDYIDAADNSASIAFDATYADVTS